MGVMKGIAEDFEAYIKGLSQQELLAMVEGLIKDQELGPRQMLIIMRRARWKTVIDSPKSDT